MKRYLFVSSVVFLCSACGTPEGNNTNNTTTNNTAKMDMSQDVDISSDASEEMSSDMKDTSDQSSTNQDMATKDMATKDMSSSMDMAMKEDMTSSNQGVMVTWPNGEPDAGKLYFKTECLTMGYCTNPTNEGFDTWHTGTLDKCTYDGNELELHVRSIDNDVKGSFYIKTSLSGAPDITFDANNAPKVDWSMPDGGSAMFFWKGDEMSNPSMIKSTGSLQLAACGTDISGVFSFKNLAEYHSVSFDPWEGNAVGAFRCTVTTPVDCSKK